MFAIVQDGTIISFPKGNKGITLNDIQYPKAIYSLWTEAQRNAIGVYEVIIDNTNFKSEEFYINTSSTYTFDSSADTVTAALGTATAKAIADTTWSQQDSDDAIMPSDKSVGDVKTTGLKTKYKNQFNAQASGLLQATDWYVIKAADVSDYDVPSNIATYRAAVRTKVNAMETAIDNCANVEALITLLEYTTDSDGVTSRPLGEFPNEVI